MWIYNFNGLSLLIFRLVTIIRWIYSLKSGLVLVATDRNKNLFNDCMWFFFNNIKVSNIIYKIKTWVIKRMKKTIVIFNQASLV